MKIAVCFFGIPRSLKRTAATIKGRVIEPAKKFGEVRIFAHYFKQDVIDNPRTGENNIKTDPQEYQALDYDRLRWDDSDDCLSEWDFDQLKAAGDAWGDQFKSLRNHIHQLASLRRIWEALSDYRPDMVIYLRPDLRYHDNFKPVLSEIIAQKVNGIVVPDWQWWWGVNDRFAICVGQDAIDTYARRIEMVKDYIRTSGKAIHAEQLLKYSLEFHGVPIHTTHLRASRVRANGVMQNEDFAPSPEALATPHLIVT